MGISSPPSLSTDFESLVQYNALLETEAAPLIQQGLLTAVDLHNALQSESSRIQISTATGITEPDLLRIALAASLLKHKGPGQFICQNWLSTAGWSSMDLELPQNREWATWFLTNDIAEFQRSIYDLAAVNDSQEKQFERRMRTVIPLMALALFVLITGYIIVHWSNFFPPNATAPDGQLVYSYRQLKEWYELLLILALVPGLIFLLIIVPRNLNELGKKWLDRRLGHVQRNEVVGYDAIAHLTKPEQRVMQSARNIGLPLLIFLATIIPIGNSWYHGFQITTESWRFRSWSLPIGFIILFLLVITPLTIKMLGLYRMNAPWATQAREHYAARQIAILLLMSMSTVLGVLATLNYTKFMSNWGTLIVKDLASQKADDYFAALETYQGDLDATNPHIWGEEFLTVTLEEYDKFNFWLQETADQSLVWVRFLVYALVIFGVAAPIIISFRKFQLKPVIAVAVYLLASEIGLAALETFIVADKFLIETISLSSLTFILFAYITENSLQNVFACRQAVECPTCHRLITSSFCEEDGTLVKPLGIN